MNTLSPEVRKTVLELVTKMLNGDETVGVQVINKLSRHWPMSRDGSSTVTCVGQVVIIETGQTEAIQLLKGVEFTSG